MVRCFLPFICAALAPAALFAHGSEIEGRIIDPQGRAVAGARLSPTNARGSVSATSDRAGWFQFRDIVPGTYTLRAAAVGFVPVSRRVSVAPMAVEETGLQFRQLAGQQQSVVMTVKSLEPEIDLRNAEVFNRTLFTRDDQIFQQLSDHRVYVDSAPHFIANAALTLAAWRGWSGSLRMRAINHYRLDGDDPSIVASGLTVFDVGAARQLTRTLELNLSLDNLTNRSYRETQNYFESRVTPAALGVARIHATPAYPLTAVAGITMRFGGK